MSHHSSQSHLETKQEKMNKKDKNSSFAQEIHRVAQEQSQGKGEEPAHSGTGS